VRYLFPHIIEDSAMKFPDKDAFRCGQDRISYVDLHNRMWQIAQLLRDHGIKRGDRVGIYLNRCLENAMAIYGTMAAGAAFVPLDPFAPAARTLLQLRDCGIRHLITHPNCHNGLKKILQGQPDLALIIGIDTDEFIPTVSWKNLEVLPFRAQYLPFLETDLAYIMYTSGSTGVPKGIMHTHYSGMSYARISADLYQLNSSDIIANHAPLYFDISTLGYFTSPFVGATTVIIPEAYTRIPVSLAELIEEERISVWYSVPLALSQILTYGMLHQRDFSAIRWVLYGGEPFPIHHLKELLKLISSARFSNVYGPAEVNQCTFYHFDRDVKLGESVPLGQVWKNTEALVIDDQDCPLNEGEVGELLIRSATMMQGYWNQQELTQKAFYFRKGNDGLEKKYYRTGDLVRYNESGELVFLGRKDRQIKVRGHRVEMDEVANAIMKYPGIGEVAVYPVRQEESFFIEVALCGHEDALDEKDLIRFLGKRLPSYAVPHRIKFRKQFPQTATGKIDYKKLQIESEHERNTSDHH
jgi:amino acid adenylation domain-containing protein